jgi:hypothetical protein
LPKGAQRPLFVGPLPDIDCEERLGGSGVMSGEPPDRRRRATAQPSDGTLGGRITFSEGKR